MGAGRPAPLIGESELLAARGLQPGSRLRVGAVTAVVDENGHARLRLADHDSLRGHAGLIEIVVDEEIAGEVEVEPDKLSTAAYERLRADLERTWAGLVFDPDGVARLRAALPEPSELWAVIENPVRQVAVDPRTVLTLGSATRRLEAVRRPGELTPSLVRAAQMGRPARTRSVVRSTNTPENAMVAATLRRLHGYAARHPAGGHVARSTAVLLAREPFRTATAATRSLTWSMLADGRYRQIHRVFRLLEHPEAAATEGPGELRLGVRGLSRLYEYWVYLQVLLAAQAAYGRPLAPGFRGLARVIGQDRARLELPAGTTITFPGPVHVSFEPRLTTGGGSWQGVEYVPHPDPGRAQRFASPDVVVFRPEPQPWITVIDAKYVGKAWVEQRAAEVHAKYARMRVAGEPAVRAVVTAHPHAGVQAVWPGYQHLWLTPGQRTEGLPLPPPPATPQPPPPLGAQLGVPVALLADQYWMHRILGGRRIDLEVLADLAGAEPLSPKQIVMPAIMPLEGFGRAAENRGWTVVRVASVDRTTSLAWLIHTAHELTAAGHDLVVISGDAVLLAQLTARGIRFRAFDEIDRVPDLIR